VLTTLELSTYLRSFLLLFNLEVYRFLKLAIISQRNCKLTSTTCITMFNFNIIPSFTFCFRESFLVVSSHQKSSASPYFTVFITHCSMTYVVVLPEVSVDIIGTADQFLGLLPSSNFRWVGKLLLFQLNFMVTPCIKQCWNLFTTNWCT